MSSARFLFLCFCVNLSAAVSMQFFSWERLVNQNVTSYEKATSALSVISCVGECTKHSQCDSCAYDKESGKCYLQVQTETTSDRFGSSVNVFRATSPCKESEAPINSATTNVTWQRTGRNLEGDMICNDDYMYVGDRPTFRCSADGLWSPLAAGQCRQKVWRNPQITGGFPMPRVPVPGWTVCMRGTPLQATRLSINLQKDGANIVFHADSRFNFDGQTNVFRLSTEINGVWSSIGSKLVVPFPVHVGQAFLMVLKATTLKDVEFYVDGQLIGTYATTLSVATVTRVFARGDVSIDNMDLWCSP